MLVRCIKATMTNPSALLQKTGWNDASWGLTVGTEYEVYAVYRSWYGDSEDAYLICDDINGIGIKGGPIYAPMAYFEIVDGTMPSFWIKEPEFPGYYGPAGLMNDYEKLVDGERTALASFQWMKCFLVGSELMRLKETDTDGIVIFISEKIIGRDSIIKFIQKELNSPYYPYQGGWDNLLTDLLDLSWINKKHIDIVHYNLPVLDDSEMQNYFSVLKTVFDCWGRNSRYTTHNNLGKPCMNIYFRDLIKHKVEKLWGGI